MSNVWSVRAVVGDAVSRWARDSQHGARRNAMIASTAMAARRQERDEVEDFLSDRTGGPDDVAEAEREARRGS